MRIKPISRRAGALLGCLVAGAAPAYAAPEAGGASGGAIGERRIDIGVTADGLYDTNVSHTAKGLAPRRGLKKADVRFTPGLTIDALLPFGRQSLAISGLAGYDFYARNTRLNRERIQLDSVLTLRAGRCDGSVNGSYSRRQSELGDLLVIDPNGNFNRGVRNAEDFKTIGATAICGGEVGFKPTASISQTWADNSSAIRRFSDFRSTTVSGGIAYARPSLGLVTLFGSYRVTDFPHRPLAVGSDRDDGFTSTSGGLRLERSIGSRLTGLAELSYSHVDPRRAGVRTFSGITWRLNATAEVSSRLKAVAEVSRSVEASNRVDSNYNIERILSLQLTYALSERLTLNAGATQRNRDFRGAGLVTLPGVILAPTLRKDRERTFDGGIRFSPNQRFTFHLDAAHISRQANGTIYDYSTNQIGFGVALKFWHRQG